MNCGIWPHVAGFAVAHDGVYSGFEVDICRAVAAAIFADAGRVKFTELASIAQLRKRHEVDLALRRLTYTPDREEGTGTVFGPIVFYDGLGFLVRNSAHITSVAQLSRVCVMDVDRYLKTLLVYFKDAGRDVQLTLVSNDQEAERALQGNRCEAYAADLSWLAAARAGFVTGVQSYSLLPQMISKEPLAPLMRAKDTDLQQVVRWTLYAMVNAEELGVSSTNIGVMESRSSRVRDLLSSRPRSDTVFADDWVRAIIGEVGNYGEVFDRNLGEGGAIKMSRGLNRLWTDGGLMYAPTLKTP